MDRLKQIGTQLQYLEERKQIAINNEDFDSARIINAEVMRLRGAIAPDSLVNKYNEHLLVNELPPVNKTSHRQWNDNETKNQLVLFKFNDFFFFLLFCVRFIF